MENVIADILISKEFLWDAEHFNSRHERAKNFSRAERLRDFVSVKLMKMD